MNAADSIAVPAGYRIAHGTGQGLRVSGRGRAPRLLKNEMKGCGPFLHDDPRDRPSEMFGGAVTLHTDERRPSYLLLPVIP
ncbi:MAG: hypothetical protein GEU68_07655 [Actinobacteria bacterium]|nr:hypothetical protein [Actinomycetota bacterium]